VISDSEEENLPRNKGKQEDPFNKAVKEAERSILIFNLNLGRSPSMNPTSISSKVTVSLLNAMSAKENKLPGHHSNDTKEFIDDILSQVTKMEFFGAKTIPCKFPNDSKRNGEFYTVPVKMMFRDRKAAQTASELFRTVLGINSTTPYHRSLRAAMTQVVGQVKEENPGHQCKVNLDLNGRSLKCFIRRDSNPPGEWYSAGSNHKLSASALDPQTRHMGKSTRPTSPSALRDKDIRDNSSGSYFRNDSSPPPRQSPILGADKGNKEPVRMDVEITVENSSNAGQDKGNKSTQLLSDAAKTPTKMPKGKSPFLPSGTAKVLRSPPGAPADRRSSLGS
jgi:hypothetical protein